MFGEVGANTWVTSADDITEGWLLHERNTGGYTDHVRHWKQFFKMMKVRTFLEFGVGFSTKYFLENSERVISVEFITPGSGPEWLKYCIHLYRNFKTWVPLAYFTGKNLDTSWAQYKYLGAESVYRAASYQPVHCQSYASIDPSFLEDLQRFVHQQVAMNDIDVAFVDPGVCLRGDLVQILFHNVPIIAAHDVPPKENRMVNDVYGYGRVTVPEDYEEIYVPIGKGMAFWVKNEERYIDVIKGLQEYVSQRR
jgi:hypothetical protein